MLCLVMVTEYGVWGPNEEGGVTGVGVNWRGVVVGDCVVQSVVLSSPFCALFVVSHQRLEIDPVQLLYIQTGKVSNGDS